MLESSPPEQLPEQPSRARSASVPLPRTPRTPTAEARGAAHQLAARVAEAEAEGVGALVPRPVAHFLLP